MTARDSRPRWKDRPAAFWMMCGAIAEAPLLVSEFFWPGRCSLFGKIFGECPLPVGHLIGLALFFFALVCAVAHWLWPVSNPE